MHIVFLMSDTGGGHRAACRAMIAALEQRHPEPHAFTTELVDMWKDYMPFPLNNMPRTYTRWINTSPATYAAQYWVNDRMFRLKWYSRSYCRQMYPRMRRFYEEHPADLYVCAHSVFVRPAVYALRRGKLSAPFVTVITDWALPPLVWYDPQVDRCLAPTPPAYARGLACGLTPDQLIMTGAVVHPKFSALTMSKAEARAQLGWDQSAKITLMIGGGDGMGPLTETAQAIDAIDRLALGSIDLQQVIVAGRNEALKAKLEALQWHHKVSVLGFRDDLQVLMRAADVLITKAGPATITEAALIGLPLILSDAIPFQESPNVDYAVSKGAALYAPGPTRVAQALTTVLYDGGATLDRMSSDIKSLAEPDAIWRIADEIWHFATIRSTVGS